MNFSAIGAAFAAICLASGSASAATLTFDGSFSGPVYKEAGVTIERLGASERDVNITDGTLGWDCCTGPFHAEYKISTGHTLSLIGFDAVHINAADPVTFEGWVGGSMVYNLIYSGLDDFSALLGGFNDVDYAILKFDATTSDGDPRIDNLEFVGEVDSPAPVPLPAAGILLVAALGGLTALRRKSV